MATTDAYDASEIQVLSSIDAVRLRPGMFLGSTDVHGMHHLLLEVLGNAVDENLAGFAHNIDVSIDGPRITIEDDGRGIPPAAIETVFTQLTATSKFPHVHLSSNLWGIGVVPVNALARELEVSVWRDGHAYHQRFERGKAVSPLVHRGPSERTGTRVSFVPDFDILERHAWDAARIAERCRDLAMLLPDVVLTVDGHAFHYASSLQRLREDHGELVEPLHVKTKQDGVVVELAIGWCSGEGRITSFVNCSPTPGGVHLVAMRAAVHAIVARRFKRIARSRVERHMVAILNVMLVDPYFGNPTRDWLTNPEVGEAVRVVVERELTRHFDEAPAALDALLLMLQRAGRRRRPSHI